MAERKWQVVATRDNGNVVQVRHVAGILNLTGIGSKRFTDEGSVEAKKWARKQKNCNDIRRTRSKYPFLILDDDTKMVKHKLAKKLNLLGKKRKKFLFINEGWRTHQRQWQLWRVYQAGGNLAAYPGTSNHEDGWAADTSYFVNGRYGERVNIGEDRQCRDLMKVLGLCLPVKGEPWHCELCRKITLRA